MTSVSITFTITGFHSYSSVRIVEVVVCIPPDKDTLQKQLNNATLPWYL